jgi:hypothetical protein
MLEEGMALERAPLRRDWVLWRGSWVVRHRPDEPFSLGALARSSDYLINQLIPNRWLCFPKTCLLSCKSRNHESLLCGSNSRAMPRTMVWRLFDGPSRQVSQVGEHPMCKC